MTIRANQSLTPYNSPGYISTSRWNAKVFQVGSADAVLKSLVMPLYETGGVSRTINIGLYNVDGSNNPTGSALASDTYTQTFTTSAQYYTISTTLGGYTMTSGQKYALVVNSNAPSTTMSWSGQSAGATPYPVYSAASGWTYVEGRRTLDSGSSWNTNSYYNGMQMTVTTAVPEPSTFVLAGLGFGGFLLNRLRKRGRRVPPV